MSKRFVRQEKSAPKHPHFSSTQPINKEAYVPTNLSRPEWRGTGRQKPKKRQPAQVLSREKELEIPNTVSRDLQQKLLDVIKSTFPVCATDYESLKPILTAVKACLDQDSAGDSKQKNFAETEMREAFCIRWGAERASALAALLVGWAESAFREESVFEKLRSRDPMSPLNVISIGDAPSSMMALSALLRQVQLGGTPSEINPSDVSVAAADVDTAPPPYIALQLVQDSPDWATETTALFAALRAPPTLSKYASAAAKAAARPFLLRDSLDLHQRCRDDLDHEEKLTELVGQTPCLIAMCFSLREMQSASVAKTAKFLVALTKVAPKDSLLMVVDEIESASKKEQPYSLRFLLDMALLGRDGQHDDKARGAVREADAPEPGWVRLVGDDERIFKIEPGLEYPLSLGKVVMQVHLFKRQ